MVSEELESRLRFRRKWGVKYGVPSTEYRVLIAPRFILHTLRFITPYFVLYHSVLSTPHPHAPQTIMCPVSFAFLRKHCRAPLAACRPVLGVALLLAFHAHLFAAEKPATEKPDPILADLKTTAKAEWEPKGADAKGKPKPPTLKIVVHLHGSAIDRASCVDEWKLDSAVDESGKSFRWQCTSKVGIHDSPEIIDHGDGDAEFHFKVPNHPTIRSIRELRGSLSLLTGGKCEQVIVPNAFKHLRTPIKADDLDALGIVWIRVARQPKSKWPRDPKIKDSFKIRAALSANAIIGCEILGADGQSISKGTRLLSDDSASAGAGGVWSRLFSAVLGLDDSEPDGKQHVAMSLDVGVQVPEDAKLRLTVQKDTKIRMPFSVKHILIPDIEKNIDIPASREDAFVDATPISRDDPILAGLKFRAEADWRSSCGELNIAKGSEPLHCCKTYDLVYAAVELTLLGKAAELTSAYGEVDLTSVRDEDGNPLDLFPTGNWEMQKRLNVTGNPEVRLTFTPQRPLHKIRELRGTMALETSDQCSVVTIKDLLKKIKPAIPLDDASLKAPGEVKIRPGMPLDDASLKALGVKVVVSRSQEPAMRLGGVPIGSESLDITVEWQRNAVIEFNVRDGNGKPLDADSSSSSWTGSRSVWCRYSYSSIPPDTQLQMTVQKNSRKVRVPFVLKDIDVPPMPKDETSGASASIVPAKERK